MSPELQSLLVPTVPYWNLILRAVVVYLVVLALLRISGKRQVANLGVSELVALLLVSNAVQNSMNAGDNSLTGGLVLAAVIMVLSFFMAVLTYFSRDWERFIQGRPTLLVHRGHLQRKNMRRELLSIRELRVLLRKQGIHDMDDVEEAVLESDGYVSVLKKGDIKHDALLRVESEDEHDAM